MRGIVKRRKGASRAVPDPPPCGGSSPLLPWKWPLRVLFVFRSFTAIAVRFARISFLGALGAATRIAGKVVSFMVRIEVTAYAGRKGDERPEAFMLRGLRIGVVEIVDRWIEEGLRDRMRKRGFRVKGSDGKEHVLYYHETGREWYYSS